MCRHREMTLFTLVAIAAIVRRTFEQTLPARPENEGNSGTTRCFGELGCFSIDGVFYHPLYRPFNSFPEERHVVNTKFLVFTLENPMQEDVLSWNSTKEQVGKSHFNATRPTKVIVHGWLDTIFLESWPEGTGLLQSSPEFEKHLPAIMPTVNTGTTTSRRITWNYPNTTVSTVVLGDSHIRYLFQHFDPNVAGNPAFVSQYGALIKDMTTLLDFVPSTASTVVIYAGTNDLAFNTAHVVFDRLRILLQAITKEYSQLKRIYVKNLKKIMKTAFLLVGDYNVLIVDWQGGNDFPYTQAAANARLVGAEIAVFIGKLQAIFGVGPESFHWLGHSLGAHVAGYARKRVPNLGRITGMDPAKPYFERMPAQVRLDRTDAHFVDVVHTNGAPLVPAILKGEGLGMHDPVGHIDFYPNGGADMPGCGLGSTVYKLITEGTHAVGACSHQRAVDYVMETITDVHCSSLAFACPSYEVFERGRCTDCGRDGSLCARMGMHADGWMRFKNDSRSERMFLVTNNETPFCAYQFLINVEMLWDPSGTAASGDLFLRLEGTEDSCEMKVNTDTVTLYPKATYTFVAKTPTYFGDVKKASVTYKSNTLFNIFAPKMLLWRVGIMPMNSPTNRHLVAISKGMTLSKYLAE